VVRPMHAAAAQAGFAMLRFAAAGDPERAPDTRRQIEASLAALPEEHRHAGQVRGPCYACALLVPGLRSDLGMLLVLEGRAEEAVEVLQDAEQLIPQHPDQAANLGAAYLQLATRSEPPSRDLLRRALEAYRLAHQRRPSERFSSLHRNVEALLDTA
jgi:tetratricopeptide (TPR) repeat protein